MNEFSPGLYVPKIMIPVNSVGSLASVIVTLKEPYTMENMDLSRTTDRKFRQQSKPRG